MRLSPNRVIWVLNSACPSRCKVCDIASQQGRPELSREVVVRVAREVRDLGFREVVFVGGEPLLSPALPVALEALGRGVDRAVFTGGIPGDAHRLIEPLAQADRLVASIDDADDARNDELRGRAGITAALFQLLGAVRERLPGLYLSTNSVVSRHNVAHVAQLWPRVRELRPTCFALSVAGENFETLPLAHLASRAWLERLYFELVPALAPQVRDAGTDFVVLPVPLPLLALGVPPERWGDESVRSSAPVRAEVELFSRGEHNRSFVTRHGCPLVGRDISIGVSGDVHPCSQAPILKSAHVLGNVTRESLAEILAGPRLREFADRVPHAPCIRCWAPSNAPREVLAETLARGSE